ncbi:MAG TPA: SDR family NAD(P)-dependent oxidoreductase [Caulobacteraceae bacterium]|nr:SDR family NAD(P)-dependent oxidoreductase [Caulobacteraceae bacterium]
MSKAIVVVGFGPGISTSVAERFGAAGFAVALVARSEERMAAGVDALKAKGVAAAAFVGDAGDPASIRAAIRKARDSLGPITAIHWNAIGGAEAGDLLTVAPETVREVFDVAVVGLLAAVEEALPDLKSAGDGAVLVTNGAFGDAVPAMDALAVQLKSTGVALANAAKHKLVGLLSERLRADGVYVGEVTVAGAIKGTPFDNGAMTIEGAAVAERFWQLYQGRGEIRARVMPG